MERAARDPLLRRLITVHVLATASVSASWYYDRDDSALQRSARWLKMVQEQKLTQLEDAEYLGWAAYNSGDYTGAAHWLDLAQKNSPATLWLRAKLQRRAGKISEAAKSMAQAWQSLRESPIYALSDDADADGPNRLFRDLHWAPMESATGDLGALRLERSEYLLALETLLQGDLWSDAAFVAERVLRTNELKAYIDEHSAAAGEKTAPRWKNLRYLLGRRLVREERYDEAVAYLPQPYDQVLRKYAAALRAGRDRSRAEKERARSLFTAAWLARHEGMELMGTEGAPNNFSEAGNFEASDLAQQIQSGTYRVTDYLQAGGPQVMTKKIALRLPSRARSRLTNSEVEPNRRFHYRYLASALALRAAALLPNDSEELADVVNCAGHWVKNATKNSATAITRSSSSAPPTPPSAEPRSRIIGLWMSADRGARRKRRHTKRCARNLISRPRTRGALRASARAATFLRAVTTEQTAPHRAAPDEGLENAREHRLRRPADGLGKSVCDRLGADWRGKVECEEIDRALSAICARRL